MNNLSLFLQGQHFLERLLENVGLGTAEPSDKHCENMTLLAQEARLTCAMSQRQCLGGVIIQPG